MKLTFGLIVNIIIVIYLFLDAPKHNKSRWLWAILGLVFGLIALGIYLIQTGRKVLGWIITIVSILIYLLIIFFVVIAVIIFSTSGVF
ncbi:hypothetical protein QNH20_25720 [Neobacillus sp. WH10]|uniref:hypothetical protein n=1 Tax=Neobacillus sp. WH10 TaxID=3047873 RepID=UPI0024C1C45C|nr:hypothetical protein [Neobacillus sp. WH10]WHY77417.1 hypothetical protein QNH20_25720 [Neobacillus sp. WH10]